MATKILFVANTGWYLYNFRLPLARLLRSAGVEVVMVSPDDPYVSRMKAEGFRCVDYKMNRRSMNPLKEIAALGNLVAIYWRERPTAVHHFTIKPVLYGTIAAKLTGTRSVVNALTGLGHIFVGSTFKARVLRPFVKFMYRQILTARRGRVIFQNSDDLQAFMDMRLVVPNRTVLIKGSGVNTQRFRPRPGGPESAPAPIVFFASRLIADKGVREFVAAARQLRASGVQATFQIAGGPDQGNPTSISDELLEDWRREGAVDLLGHVENSAMADLLGAATIVVLASYGGEGTPRILLEAGAMGKPIVTTDVPGCREAVAHNVNGLIVPPRDANALAAAIGSLLGSPELCERMGEASREKIVREFDEQHVMERTMQVYRSLGAIGDSIADAGEQSIRRISDLKSATTPGHSAT